MQSGGSGASGSDASGGAGGAGDGKDPKKGGHRRHPAVDGRDPEVAAKIKRGIERAPLNKLLDEIKEGKNSEEIIKK
jgi:hypothetical protein